MIVYKIRAKNGQFSNGGGWPTFKNVGKVWKRKRDVNLHLSQLSSHGINLYQKMDAHVIEYELLEREVGSKYFSQYIIEIQRARLEREENARIGREMHAKGLRRRQYEELKKEFGEQ